MSMADHIKGLIESQDETTGIDIRTLQPGDCVRAFTLNSMYEIVVLPGCEIQVRGDGRYFNEFEQVYFSGSTWGGSMLKVKWVGVGMCMEFHRKKPSGVNNMVLTSFVQKIQILRAEKE